MSASATIDRYLPAVVLLLIGIVTAPGLFNAFVLEDEMILGQTAFWTDSSRAADLFQRSGHEAIYGEQAGAIDQPDGSETRPISIFRPTTHLSYMLDSQLWGFNPFGFHLTNWLLHLVACLLLFLYVRSTGVALGIAAYVTLVFGLHPIPTEAHLYVVGRSNVLATICLFGALLWLPAQTEQRTRAWSSRKIAVALVLLLLANLTKETTLLVAIAAACFALLSPWVSGSQPSREGLRQLRVIAGVFLAPVAGYLLLRSIALSEVSGLGSWGSLLPALERLPHYLLNSALQFVLPWKLGVRLLWEEYLLVDGQLLLVAAAALGASFGGLIWLALKERNATALRYWTFYCVALAPSALVTTFPGWVGQNRYLYLPFAFLTCLLAHALGRMTTGIGERFLRRWGRLLGGLSIAILAVLMWTQTRNWQSSATVIDAAAVNYPKASYPIMMSASLDDVFEVYGPKLWLEVLERNPDEVKTREKLIEYLIAVGEPDVCSGIALEGVLRHPEFDPRFQLWRFQCLVGHERVGAISSLIDAVAAGVTDDEATAMIRFLLDSDPTVKRSMIVDHMRAIQRPPATTQRLHRLLAELEAHG